MKTSTVTAIIALFALGNSQKHSSFILFTLTFFITWLFYFLVSCAFAACDPWGARKCGIEFFDCYNNTIPLRKTGTNAPADLICQCFQKQGACLRKYKCATGPTFSIFNSDCLAQRCRDYQCSAASSTVASVAAILVGVLFAFF